MDDQQPTDITPGSDELADLRHFKDSVSGLWCIDHDPKDKTIEWIREHAFQLE